MESDQEWASLGQFIFEHIEVGFDALETSVVDFRSFVMHRYQILV